MRTVAEHRAAIEALLAPLVGLEPEDVAVDAAASDLLHRVLARDVVSPLDHPPFDNSQMDGYAVRAAEAGGAPLRVARRIAAGHAPPPLRPGSAAPIMTGAPIPEGADAVVPIERADPDAFPPEGAEADEHVVRLVTTEPGEYVRPRGSDLRAGGLLLPGGTVLGPAQWGVIAASGIASVPVRRRARVLVVSTGDELQPGAGPLGPGRIHDTNGVSMATAVRAAGGVPVLVEAVTDDAAALARTLAAAAPSVDLVLTTGGVSAGAYEVVRDALAPVGVRFESVAMQPGGPQGWGVGAEGVPTVCFPGNPVSALVSFEVFLGPVLRRLHGRPQRAVARAPLAESLTSPPGKHQVRRGRTDASGRVELVGGPSSHLLHHYAASTLLVHVPLGVSALDAGDDVEIWRIDD